MDLCAVTVAGYRRFSNKTKLQTNGKLVAILGPNEVGKTSLLRAIQLLSHDDAPANEDFAREVSREQFQIEARYFLSDEDAAAAGLSNRQWLYVRKHADGRRSFELDPPAPVRNLGARRKMKRALEQVLEGLPGDIDALNYVSELLSLEREDLSTDEVAAIDERLAELEGAVDYNVGGMIWRDREEFRDAEVSANPTDFAISALKLRLPEILMFDEGARDLRGSYIISELHEFVPVALENLFRLAKIDTQKLLSAYSENSDAEVATLEEGANEVLRERLKKDWQQSGLRISLRSRDGRLAVHVVNAAHTFTSLAERSDGLRQFVALQAFSSGTHLGERILLIDEAETRLHYDAQADLVQMLARQQLATKVIYTTHSAGCLPEDLGNGVRLVHTLKNDDTRSAIDNRFWGDSAAGVTPVLIGLGATTMAFFPTRHALLVEGAGDMLLLPTLFREALGSTILGFQVVPGLSSSSSGKFVHARAIGEAAGILYLVDSDQGGLDLRSKLIADGADTKNIFLLEDSLEEAEEIEDFLDSSLIVEAANMLMKKYFPKSKLINLHDLPSVKRMAYIQNSYEERTGREISKIDLAYEVLDILDENPLRRAVDADRLEDLKNIAASIISRFKKL